MIGASMQKVDSVSGATFGQDRPRGYVSPYSQSYHSFLYFFLCTQNLSTDLELSGR